MTELTTDLLIVNKNSSFRVSDIAEMPKIIGLVPATRRENICPLLSRKALPHSGLEEWKVNLGNLKMRKSSPGRNDPRASILHLWRPALLHRHKTRASGSWARGNNQKTYLHRGWRGCRFQSETSLDSRISAWLRRFNLTPATSSQVLPELVPIFVAALQTFPQLSESPKIPDRSNAMVQASEVFTLQEIFHKMLKYVNVEGMCRVCVHRDMEGGIWECVRWTYPIQEAGRPEGHFPLEHRMTEGENRQRHKTNPVRTTSSLFVLFFHLSAHLFPLAFSLFSSLPSATARCEILLSVHSVSHCCVRMRGKKNTPKTNSKRRWREKKKIRFAEG